MGSTVRFYDETWHWQSVWSTDCAQSTVRFTIKKGIGSLYGVQAVHRVQCAFTIVQRVLFACIHVYKHPRQTCVHSRVLMQSLRRFPCVALTTYSAVVQQIGL